MRKSDLILPWAAVLLSACAQQSAGYPAARAPYPAQQFPYPVQRQDPLRDTSQQLYSVEQILRQLQNLQSTVSRFKLVPHAVLLLVLSVIVLAPKYTLFAWNYTPSMPEGLYVRAIIDTPAVGKIIAFPAPTSVVEYTRRRGRTEALPLLAKSLAAGPGDHVCVTDHLTINDQRIAPVLENGPDGVPLPRWRECRQLGSGEWFAYADRIPNSLDSRYYGPVHQSEIVGVFRPLWTADN